MEQVRVDVPEMGPLDAGESGQGSGIRESMDSIDESPADLGAGGASGHGSSNVRGLMVCVRHHPSFDGGKVVEVYNEKGTLLVPGNEDSSSHVNALIERLENTNPTDPNFKIVKTEAFSMSARSRLSAESIRNMFAVHATDPSDRAIEKQDDGQKTPSSASTDRMRRISGVAGFPAMVVLNADRSSPMVELRIWDAQISEQRRRTEFIQVETRISKEEPIETLIEKQKMSDRAQKAERKAQQKQMKRQQQQKMKCRRR
jgi:hypothetical protein